MANVETALTFPLTIPDGQYTTQVAYTSNTSFIARLQMAIVTVAEYIVNQESTSDTNYSDRAYYAQYVVNNPQYYAQQLAWVVAADPATVNSSMTDQELSNRVWTIWPVGSYKRATIEPTTPGAG